MEKVVYCLFQEKISETFK